MHGFLLIMRIYLSLKTNTRHSGFGSERCYASHKMEEKFMLLVLYIIHLIYLPIYLICIQWMERVPGCWLSN